MLKFLCLLSVVLAPTAAQTFGPFHGTADDFGNVYWYSASGSPSLNPLNNEVLDNWRYSYPLGKFPKPSTTAMVFAASNQGTWSDINPAGILLSSDTGATPRIVSDKSWVCKGYADLPGVTRKQWSSSASVKADIQQAISTQAYKNWLPAVEIYANFVFGTWGIRDKIPLGAHWIWADGLGADNDLPPENVICIKDLSV